jgi:hypothetical protein
MNYTDRSDPPTVLTSIGRNDILPFDKSIRQDSRLPLISSFSSLIRLFHLADSRLYIEYLVCRSHFKLDSMNRIPLLSTNMVEV